MLKIQINRPTSLPGVGIDHWRYRADRAHCHHSAGYKRRLLISDQYIKDRQAADAR